jgi:ethanolamine utilization protein EutQ
MGKRLITAEDIIRAAEKGNTTVTAPPGECIVTPMARDQAETLGITIDQGTISDGDDSLTIENVPGELIVSQVCELIKNKLPSVADTGALEQLVREKIAARFDTALSGPEPPAEGDTCVEGVCFVSGRRLMAGGTQPIPVEETILVADAIQCGDGNQLSGGCMEW